MREDRNWRVGDRRTNISTTIYNCVRLIHVISIKVWDSSRPELRIPEDIGGFLRILAVLRFTHDFDDIHGWALLCDGPEANCCELFGRGLVHGAGRPKSHSRVRLSSNTRFSSCTFQIATKNSLLHILLHDGPAILSTAAATALRCTLLAPTASRV